MVSQALVQSKANYGFSRAASALGAANAHYRASDSTAPIASGNLLGSVTTLYDTNANLKQAVPSRREKPDDWFGAFDRTGVRVGDYLVDPTLGTFFVASLELFRPARMVLCNHVLTFSRPAEQDPAASGYYEGVSVDDNLLTSWPCAVTQGTKGETGEAKLPGDLKVAWVQILLPPTPVQIRFGDVAVNEQAIPQHYTISSTELTALGWRLTAMMALT